MFVISACRQIRSEYTYYTRMSIGNVTLQPDGNEKIHNSGIGG